MFYIEGMIFTIGHSNRSAAEFTALLQRYGISYLADVRSAPYSRYNPQYNQKALQQHLANNGIAYVYMGNELGGMPKNPSCYDDDGRLNYGLVSQTTFFKAGIERLQTADAKQLPVAIMCSEAKPQECHRSILISPALRALGIEVIHIDEKGELKTYAEVATLLNKSQNPRLF